MTDPSSFQTNRDLFSNHYLTDTLRDREPWNEVSDEEVREAYEEISDLVDSKLDRVEDYNEAQLERNLIRPIFDILGIPFEIEETVERNARRPDYGFFPSDEAADAAFDREDFYEESITVADAKRWGRKLDTRGEEKRDFENPSYQIHRYLQETPTQWGVLTNGAQWRLYYEPTSHRLDSYYEIDLPAILDTVAEEDGIESFKYFYLFFRQEAFLPDQTGDCFLDDVYSESNVFAEELGEDLQENIYEAIRVLAEGFIETNEELDEADLDLIHDSSLIYLYRLIFVLYAESEGRNLLPTNNEIYSSSYSLNQLKQTVVERRSETQQHYQTWQTDLWDRLNELFVLIDQGSQGHNIPKEDLYIPAYNGGLFRTDPDQGDSDEAQFLASNEVGDEYIAEVIELLTRHEASEGDGKVFVDYSSLDERNLGSIYEGLLEYKLDVADEPLTVEDGEYSTAEDDDDVAVQTGDVYLRTDDGERKATGSYYTPEYVVEYIVDETLGPIVDDIREDMLAESARGEEQKFAEEFADRVFGLTVLDPAMGSGHFLVNAVDYLAREIIDAQEKQDRQAIESEQDEARSPTTEEGELRDINWARRKVAQRCIYGVDVNGLATELSKVSLWLRTLAAEQPLAFLDHHLKTGNSLVGSDITTVLSEDNGGDDGQLTLTQSFARARQETLGHVMDLMQDLLAIDNDELDDIKSMEELYDEIRADPLYQRLFEIANVHTAEQFGLDVPSGVYEEMAGAVDDADEWAEIRERDWFRSAQATAEEQGFFHWELEYPEVFFNEEGKKLAGAGFDALIGNPPWVRSINLKQANKSNWRYLKENFESARDGEYDIYLCFAELGLSLINAEGEFGYIIPNKWFTSDVGENLRRILSDGNYIKEIIDFGSHQLFDGITTYSCLIFLNKQDTDQIAVSKLEDSEQQEHPEIENSESWQRGTVASDTISGESWSFNIGPIGKLFNNLEELPKLGDHANIFKGVGTNADTVYLLENKKDGFYSKELDEVIDLEEGILRPALKGNDIDSYHYDRNHRLLFPYMINNGDVELLSEDRLKEDFPKAWDYLERVQETLESRESGKYRGDKDWYRFGRPQNMALLAQMKAVLPDVVNESTLAFDSEGRYILDTAYGIISDEYSSKYLTSVLNSDLLTNFLHLTGTDLRGGYFRMKTAYLDPFPIPDIDFTTPDVERESRVSELAAEYHEYVKKDSSKPLPQEDDIAHDFLATLTDKMTELNENLDDLNLNLLDHLGNYSDGQSLADIGLTQPPAGAADSILQATTETYPNLRVGAAEVVRESPSTVEIQLTARYKPDDEEEYETDQWGYTETELLPALQITDLNETEADLISAFVPVAIDEAGGFAGFRESVTKTNSLIDRLQKLTLPSIADVETGLEQYREAKQRADELEDKIQRTDDLIDEIVYELYGLTDEEIEIVEEAVADD